MEQNRKPRDKPSHLWRRQWQPTPVLLPGKSHGWRSLEGCSPRGREESDTTEPLHFHFSLSCTGEGNGTPLQCSCLENPRDRGASWAAVYGVAQSRTRLKQLSSSSSESIDCLEKYTHFHCIDSSDPLTWYVSSSIYFIFDFFHQCFIVLCIQVFSFFR